LKDDLQPASDSPHSAAIELSDVLAVNDNATGGWFDQSQDKPPGCRLAATGLADETECFPSVE
jgi:hypothetical protein